jgi:uncharacterized protein YPO0396
MRNSTIDWPGGHLHRPFPGAAQAILGPRFRWKAGDRIRLPDGSIWTVGSIDRDGLAAAVDRKALRAHRKALRAHEEALEALAARIEGEEAQAQAEAEAPEDEPEAARP